MCQNRGSYWSLQNLFIQTYFLCIIICVQFAIRSGQSGLNPRPFLWGWTALPSFQVCSLFLQWSLWFECKDFLIRSTHSDEVSWKESFLYIGALLTKMYCHRLLNTIPYYAIRLYHPWVHKTKWYSDVTLGKFFRPNHFTR